MAFLHTGGTIVLRELRAGQTLRVDTLRGGTVSLCDLCHAQAARERISFEVSHARFLEDH